MLWKHLKTWDDEVANAEVEVPIIAATDAIGSTRTLCALKWKQTPQHVAGKKKVDFILESLHSSKKVQHHTENYRAHKEMTMLEQKLHP